MTVAGKRWAIGLKDLFQLVMAAATVITLTGSVFVWTLPRLFPEWAAIPDRIAAVEASMQTLASARPAVVVFSGAGIVSAPTVAAGESLTVVYVLRRTIACETTVNMRFWDHDTNTVIAGPSMPAVRSPVSPDFGPFAVRVKIPDELPPGHYSYLPEIVPLNCGVYGAITPPMSETFEVVK